MIHPLSAPKQGQNLHLWLLRNSRELLIEGYSEEKTCRILLEAGRDSERTTQDLETEIGNAVVGAKKFLEDHPGFVSKGRKGIPKWKDPLDWVGLGDPMIRKDRRSWILPVNEELIDKILANEDNYQTRSTFLTMTNGRDDMGEEFNFPDLFAGIDLLICAGRDVHSPIVKPLSRWQQRFEDETNLLQFIVPNYFRKAGIGKGCKNDFNIGERLYIVIEFDHYDLEDQFVLLWHLSGKLDLAMVVFSGGKSLHGWFTCYGLGEYKVRSFIRKAIELGADPNGVTRSPSQWVRMPNGFNYKHWERQKVLWYNYEAILLQKDIVREELMLMP